MNELYLLLGWLAVWGVIGALIAPRKGFTPGEGFGLGAVLAIIGIAYIATRPDVKPRQVRLYQGRTADEAEASFMQDAQQGSWSGMYPAHVERQVNAGWYQIRATYERR